MDTPPKGLQQGPGVFATIPAATVEIVPIKPGPMTTEFAVSAATIGGTLWAVLKDALPPWVGAVVSGGVAVAYTIARTWAKVRAMRPPAR